MAKDNVIQFLPWLKKAHEFRITHSELNKSYCAIHEHASPPNYDGCEKGDEDCIDIMANYKEALDLHTTPYKLSHLRLEEREASAYRGCQTCDSDRGCRCDYMEDERTGN